MTFHQRMFHLLDSLDIDQKDFAAHIDTSAQIVSKWRTGTLKSYTKHLGSIAAFFGVTPDYFLGNGVLQNWESILEYAAEVCSELRSIIPTEYYDPTVDEDHYLVAWLDKRMRYGISGADEVRLIQWFHANVASVDFVGQSKELNISIQLKESSPLFMLQRLTTPNKKEQPATVSGDGQAEKLAAALKAIGIEVDNLSDAEISRIAKLAKVALEE